jgi:hypothetical protein
MVYLTKYVEKYFYSSVSVMFITPATATKVNEGLLGVTNCREIIWKICLFYALFLTFSMWQHT